MASAFPATHQSHVTLVALFIQAHNRRTRITSVAKHTVPGSLVVQPSREVEIRPYFITTRTWPFS